MIKKNLFLFLIVFGFYLTLNTSFMFFDILIGLIISFITVLFTTKFLKSNRPHNSYPKVNLSNFIIFIKYIFITLYHVFYSGIKSMIYLVKRKTNIKIIKVPTKLEKSWAIYLLAMTITLTPGTITLYSKDNIL